MSSMKLIYFDRRGRAEITRMLFKLSGKDFVDYHMSMEEWKTVKPTMPKQQLPVLEVNGQMICESMAIARFVARETGLYGADNWEAAVCDMVLDTVIQVIDAAKHMFKAKTDDHKEKARKNLFELIEVFEKMVASVKSGSFILGEKASLADTAIFGAVEICKAAKPNFDCPTLCAIEDNFSKVPAIADWLKVRPAKI